MSSKVHLIGIGEDGLRGLRDQERALIAGADLLCGGTRHLALAEYSCADDAVHLITADLPALLGRIRPVHERGGQVVVLASGDPLLYGIGAYLGEHLGRDVLDVRPTLSSPQLAFARLAIPWQDATVLSVHGRPLLPVLGRAMAATVVAFLTDARNTPAVIARALLERGMEDAAVAVCERLGGLEERVVPALLSTVVGQAFDPLNVLVVMRDPAAVRWGHPHLGQPEAAYAHVRGLVTKAEVRAVSLAGLGLGRPAVRTVWDIGAGSGSVAIEAASLRLDAVVYAVERDAGQLALLGDNIRHYQAGNVAVVAGEAPAALTSLPDPDAAFVGGSGGRLIDVLGAVTNRLRPGGRLVMNLVVLEHLAAARSFLDRAGWAVSVTQIHVAREARTGNAKRLAALNPVFILSAERAA